MKLAAFSLVALAALQAALPAQTVFKGAKVYPVASNPIENGIVIVQGGKIIAVGDAKTSIPEGAKIIDCTGKGTAVLIQELHSLSSSP